jgi:hypothetical protein
LTIQFHGVLEDHLKSGSLISIFLDEWEKFDFGRLRYLNHEIYVFETFTKFGDHDGFAVRRVSDITKIERDGKYERALMKLVAKLLDVSPKYSLVLSGASCNFTDVLRVAQNSRAFITIWGAGEAIAGMVSDLTDEYVVLDIVDRVGERDGKAIIPTSDITGIDYETRQEQLLRRLFDLGGEV